MIWDREFARADNEAGEGENNCQRIKDETELNRFFHFNLQVDNAYIVSRNGNGNLHINNVTSSAVGNVVDNIYTNVPETLSPPPPLYEHGTLRMDGKCRQQQHSATSAVADRKRYLIGEERHQQPLATTASSGAAAGRPSTLPLSSSVRQFPPDAHR